ncbi:succinic semialdehyde dehydrogenase [Streptomyces sp. NPDC048309]|uniref:succinic semialdehyde dehydrogenase n=1 Tax=unclassified Streptomyces TaxID=2593676 RepID=UPI0033E6CFCB
MTDNATAQRPAPADPSCRANGDTVETTSSLTGHPLARLPQSTGQEVEQAFETARRGQELWARTPLTTRAKTLLRFHDLLLNRQDEVIDLIQQETGKARWHAFQELASTTMNVRYNALRAQKVLAPTRRYGLLPWLTHVVEHRCPKGVVGVISPWNYPLDTGLSDAVPALLAGNSVVHKPDNQGALSLLWARGLLREAGLPDDVYQIVLGDGPTVGGAVVDRCDHVCFTGSSAVGRTIAEKAGRRLINCTLELGGKNALLVLDDVDPTKAAAGAVRDCFTSAGQMCGSSERLYVHDKVYDRFLDEFLRRIARMNLGVDLTYEQDMGSLVSRSQLNRVLAHVQDAKDKGAKVLTGGSPRPDIGPFFFEPTVLSGVTEDMTCFTEETFGPVVSLYRCNTTDEAVRLANHSRYGLSASVWGGSQRRAQAVGAQLQAGMVNVNEIFGVSYGSVDSPLGGMKDSGLGRRHGTEGILRFTEAQTLATQRGTTLEFNLGYTALAQGYSATLRLFRTLRRR